MKPEKEIKIEQNEINNQYGHQWAINQWRKQQIDQLLARWHALHQISGRGRRWQQAKRRLQHTATALMLSAGLLLGQAAAPAFAADPVYGTPEVNPFGLTDVGDDYSNITLADIDNDGDLDAFSGVGEYGKAVLFFENTGTATAPAFAAPVTNPFGINPAALSAWDYDTSPTFVDIDGDGDLDLFVGVANGKTLYMENTGSAAAPAFADPIENLFGLTDVGKNSSPEFADIDGDGDLDAFIGNYDGEAVYFENTGTATAPAFATPSTNPFGLTTLPSGYSNPTFVDIDGDGDLDAFIGNAGGKIFFFENTGTASAPAFATRVKNPFGLNNVSGAEDATPIFVDIDGDGDLDAFSGARYHGFTFWENTAPTAVTLDSVSVTSSSGLLATAFGALSLATASLWLRLRRQ